MGKSGIVFDMDGVVFVGDTPVQGVRGALMDLRAKGVCVLFMTNNSTKTRGAFVQKLRRMDIVARREEIMCTAYGCAFYLRRKYAGKKARAYVIGEGGLFEEIRNAGFEIVNESLAGGKAGFGTADAEDFNGNAGRIADFVVCGLDREFTYAKAAGALLHLQRKAALFGANADPTLPTESGLLPGSGSVLAMVEKASGKKAFVIGKPNAFLLLEHLKRHRIKAKDALFVGDRLDIDLAGANKCGMHSVLALSGIAKRKDVKNAPEGCKPQWIIKSAAHMREVLEKLKWD